MKVVLIQGSLRKNSRTAIVVQETSKTLATMGIETQTIDLRDYDLPFCDGRSTSEYGEPVISIYKQLEDADGYIISSPVYAYTYSGVVKNFIDIFGGAMKDKFSGAIYNAGGSNSYLASGELVKIMAFDYNHTVIQPTIYTHWRHFEDGKLNSEYVDNKINQMCTRLIQFLSSTINVTPNLNQ